MSTIMEMAQMIREQEAAMAAPPVALARNMVRQQVIDIQDSEQIQRWCRTFGTTPFQLCRVIDQVGSSVSLVKRQLQRR